VVRGTAVSPGGAEYARSPPRVRLNPVPVWVFLEERGISQNELARLAGISPGYLSQLMSGSAHPFPQMRQRLQRVLRVTDINALFTITE